MRCRLELKRFSSRPIRPGKPNDAHVGDEVSHQAARPIGRSRSPAGRRELRRPRGLVDAPMTDFRRA